jgi:hypothetical protein
MLPHPLLLRHPPVPTPPEVIIIEGEEDLVEMVPE